MTRDRLDELWKHCADLGVEVRWVDLGEIRHGEYDPVEDCIYLHIALTRRQTTAALAHELGHRKFGDLYSTPANERRAWEYAAAVLVTPDEYRAAEALVGHGLDALAAELEVTVLLVEGWRRWWETRGKLLDPESLLVGSEELT